MNDNDTTPIIMYTSNYCSHSWAVERFMKKHDVPVEFVNIDENAEARELVMSLNRGYASVPTLIFPDGTQLTEPSMGRLKEKLAMDRPGIFDKVRRLIGGRAAAAD